MKQRFMRISILSTASKAQKANYLSTVKAYKQKGMTVVHDWPFDGEEEAYVIFPHGDRFKQVATYRISSALNRAFSSSYNV